MTTHLKNQPIGSTFKSSRLGSNQIPVRHMQFVFADDFPVNFAFSNALTTSVFVALSAVFPPGERFFMDSIRYFREHIKDDELKKQIAGFIGQQAMHGREHDRFNKALIKKGFDVETGVKSITKGLGLLKKLTPIQQLACTVVMEHATAHLAIQWLTHTDLNRLSDPKTLSMWQWHALEELEHKTVSYDVYKMLGEDQWLTRFIAVCAVMGVVLPVSIYAAIVIAYKHGSHKDRMEFVHGLKLLFGQDGFLRPLITKAPDFLKKDFDPRNDDTEELEKIWKEKLLGENGILNQFYSNNKNIAS